jgi:hypothetical protein
VADKESIKTKIRALSLKTTANGATASEEASAKEMITRLLEKLGTESNNQQHRPDVEIVRQTEQPSKSYFEYLSLYQKYKKEGTLSKHAHEIDWDVLAKHLLKNNWDYMQYVHDTHSAWEKHHMTNKKLTRVNSQFYMTTTQYRQACYEKFKTIYEENTK